MRYHKQDLEGVKVVSKIVEEYGDERAAAALQQGIQKQAIEAVIKLLKNNKLSPEEIADA